MADLTPLGLGDITRPPNINTSIDTFQQQNLSPSEIFSLGNSIPQTVGGIPGIGNRIPSLSKIPIPGVSQLPSLLAPINAARFGKAGAFEAVHYADDLNKHHPKFKFLFKVIFQGFPGGNEFYFYVHRCDKPKVRFIHQDVNYYNFRTRVLTAVMYEPLQIQFLDEIGNSITDFFQAYMEQTSGTGSGNYGIDHGWGAASSTKPYRNGYTFNHGQRIVMEQIFVDLREKKGPRSNRFTFMNPRIETFDFDDLSHEDSMTGSMATMTFSYDAISTETVRDKTLYSWGTTDLFYGGGTSGKPVQGTDGAGAPMYADGAQGVKKPSSSLYDQLRKGADMIYNIPSALSGLVSSAVAPLASSLGTATSSATDTLSKGIQSTLASIQSGNNLVNGGKTAATGQTITSPSPKSVVTSSPPYS